MILWQTPKDADPLIDALPQGTRKVWDRATGQLRFRRAIRAPWITAVTRRLVQRDRDT